MLLLNTVINHLQMNKILVDIEIDKLTNSIENRITGDSFDTQVLELKKSDLSKIKKVGILIGNLNLTTL